MRSRLVVMELLPELELGGVESHVVDLSNFLAERGHDVTVVSAGGRLESGLHGPKHLKLPVVSKNPLSIILASVMLAAEVKKRKCMIMHAHSRVPGYVAWLASKMTGVPWVYSAHACYSRNIGIYPLKKADCLICVSNAVREHLKGFLPPDSLVITDGVPDTDEVWSPDKDGAVKFIFVGRLVKIKGVHTVIKALSGLPPDTRWRFDILGEGPQAEELKALSESLGLEDKIFFRGFIKNPEKWIARADCLLFPSTTEGMPLVLAQALQIGIPVLASDIPPVREALPGGRLVEPENAGAWTEAIKRYIADGVHSYDKKPVVQTFSAMAGAIEELYRRVSGREKGAV